MDMAEKIPRPSEEPMLGYKKFPPHLAIETDGRPGYLRAMSRNVAGAVDVIITMYQNATLPKAMCNNWAYCAGMLLKEGFTKEVQWVPEHKMCPRKTGESDKELYLYMVAAKSVTPITASLTIEERPLQMEVDTGAAFSIISYHTLKSKFSDLRLQHSFEDVH